tara:strand:- start:31 stop:186 length:156 start_codon:yes stop_codon:yes gene_type:complete
LLEGTSGDTTLIGRSNIGYNLSPSGSIIGFLCCLLDGGVCGSFLDGHIDFC